MENMPEEINLLHKAVVEIKKKLKKDDEELEKAMKEAEAIMAANVVEFMEDEE